MDTMPELLQLQHEFLKNFEHTNPQTSFYNLLETFPFAVAILTEDRRILFSNHTLLKKYGFKSIEQVLGKRPGEMLSCLHANRQNDQCGVSQNCKVCGALSALKKTQVTLKPNISEMHLTAVNEGSLISYELKISVSPLITPHKTYLMLYIEDVSNEKRRKIIERIFFHDILNKVSMLNGLYELMQKEKDPANFSEHIDIMGYILNDLTAEITSQRQLAAAENGELIVRMEPVELNYFMNQLIRQCEQLLIGKRIRINYINENNEIVIHSNATLLNRIITNLIKNAIEASLEGDEIIVKTETNSKVVVSVKNNAFMDEEIQLQVFMRSFSTKGENRGLGTYSVKLLTERYLGGKVWFSSNKEEGTTFYVELPLHNPAYVI